MSLSEAFNALLSIHNRVMTISRPGTALTKTITASPSNYFRNLDAFGTSVIEGREFVIPKASLDSATAWGKPKRGDRLSDSDPTIGDLTISEAREMFGIGGEIIGYRVRTS